MIGFGLDGRRALVSGAGWIPERAGHGRASARKLAEAGAIVACVDIDEGRAKGIVDEILAEGGRAFPVLADMTVRSEVERAVAEAVATMGGIDVCVDIIGKATWNRSEELSDEDWTFAIQTNLTQVFYLFQVVGKQMIAQGTGGSLVALASVDGTVASRYHAAYGAAKAGVISLAKTFADELGRHGIRVNAVAPGNVGSGNEDQVEGVWADNGINPLAAPRGTDVANAVLFLSSALAARITGQTLTVDGGATVQALWGMTPDELDQFRRF
ncbi:SDR family NAD(P)-dependent oxidoreductase [Trujillonella endophytica]|uniref:3-oxoacyl-[acyl-carrier protein] reductase n=1 Tax=Trujillonella endophytica TaxID=673521 RepID=A0A1H8SXB0_9ACTN|nr:SDR family NAD(P)-dependent oxidoreductase [Trujillella endophytica]SEO83175.1 3-oxoacyl-[acyl-carrier protein] reductase [Trujillella endophytica]